MIKHYIKIAFRNLWKYKGQNLIGILGLAMGLCIFCLCINLVIHVFEYNADIRNSRNIFSLSSEGELSLDEVRNYFPEIEKAIPGAVTERFSAKFHPEEKEVSYFISISQIDSGFIDFFSPEFLYGNKVSAKTSTNSIVLFESFAQKIGEPKNLLGKTVETENNTFVITGILKDWKGFHSFINSDAFVINIQDNSGFDSEIKANSYYVFVGDNHKELIKQKVDSFNEKNKELNGRQLKLIPFYINILKEDAEGKLFGFVLILIGLLILLATLSNYVGFHTSLFLNRLKECAIRKVTGAKRGHIFCLFYMEIMLGLLISSVFAVLFLRILIPELNYLVTSGGRNLIYFEDLLPILLNCIVVGLIGGALLSLFPAGFIYKSSIRSVIFGIGSKGGNNRARNILLGFEMFVLFAFSLCMITSLKVANDAIPDDFPAPEDYRYTYSLENRTIKLSDNTRYALLNEIQSLAGVNNAFITNKYLLSSYDDKRFMLEDSTYSAQMRMASAEIFDFLDLKPLQGMLYDDNSPPNSIVINKRMGEIFFENSNPVGQTLSGQDGSDYQVIGIVDFHSFENFRSKDKKSPPLFYIPFYDENKNYSDDPNANNSFVIYVDIQENQFNRTKEKIRQIVLRYIPEENAVIYRPLEEEILIQRNNVYAMITIFSPLFFVSLIICLLSIYSAIYMNTEKRRKEVAIRKINGAEIIDIIKLFSKQYFVMWTVVCLVGIAIIYPISRFLNNSFDINISPLFSFWLFVIIYFVILTLIYLTIIFRIMKVARENPAETLKIN